MLALLMVGLVLGLFFVAYVFFANLGLYLDFVPALLAVLIDLCFEHFKSSRESRIEESRSAA